MYSHTVEQCSEPSGGRRCHQELVTAGILVPLPAEEKEKGAVIRWTVSHREEGAATRSSSPPAPWCPCQLGRPGTEGEDCMEDRVHVQEVEVQDSIATMVEPVLAASSRGRRGG